MAPSRLLRNRSMTVLLAGLIAVGWARTAAAGGPVDANEVKAALKTTGVEEDGFVERIAALVNSGKFPRDLFDSTFLWARKKPSHRFQHFKRALTLRAAEIGIRL